MHTQGCSQIMSMPAAFTFNVKLGEHRLEGSCAAGVNAIFILQEDVWQTWPYGWNLQSQWPPSDVENSE